MYSNGRTADSIYEASHFFETPPTANLTVRSCVDPDSDNMIYEAVNNAKIAHPGYQLQRRIHI